MKNKLIALICMFGVFAMIVIPALMADQMIKDAPDAVEVSGAVVALNPQDSTVIVEYQGEGEDPDMGQVTLQVTPGTVIDDNGATTEFSAFNIGDTVSVKYKTDASGKNVAQSIMIKG